MVFQTYTTFAVRFHVLQVTTTTTEFFHHAALVGFFNVNGQVFKRLVAYAIHHFEHNAWTRYCQLEAFATHVFDQDGQVQFAATRHFVGRIIVFRLHDAQRHVGFQFFFEAITDLTCGNELAFATCQWRAVNHEVHGQRWLIDFQHRQAIRCIHCTDGGADADFFDTVDQDDVACQCFVNQYAIQAFECQDLVDTCLGWLVFRAVHPDDVLTAFDTAGQDTANADLADVGRVFQRCDLQLQWCIRIIFARWNVFQDRVEQWFHVAATDVRGQAGIAVQAGCVDDREIELFFGCAQFVEQFKCCVDGPFSACARTINFVQDNDRFQAEGQCLARHETRLWHRAFLCIHQQQYAVNHRQYTFHFTTEVGVAWGINDVDVCAFVLNRAVLRQNRDTTFLFDIVRVHHACINLLVFTEST
ncbi:hypothetical protein D3C72_468330 [compost metagenome]